MSKNTNNLIIEDEDSIFNGSGGLDENKEINTTPNYVDITSLNLIPLSKEKPKDTDILIFDGTTYVPSSMYMSLLKDVNLSDLEDKNILIYDKDSSTWVTKSVDKLINDNIQFDSISKPLTSDILSYNGSKWVPISRNTLLKSFPLTNLSDVKIDKNLDKQVLSYNSANNSWENSTLSFYNLKEIESTEPSEGNFLVFNSTKKKWEGTTLTLDKLSNFSTENKSDGDFIRYNEKKKVWETISLLELSNLIPKEVDLLELKNVQIRDKEDKQFLVWDSAVQKWINYYPSLSNLSDYNSSNSPKDKDILIWDSKTSTWISTGNTPENIFNYDTEDLQEGKVLIYDEYNNTWEPKFITLEGLIGSNIDLNTIDEGSSIYWNFISKKWEIRRRELGEILGLSNIKDKEILAFNEENSKWENKDLSSLVQLSQNLSDLNDTSILTPSDKNILVFNSTKNKWENRSISLQDIKNIISEGLDNKNVLVYNNVLSKWEPKGLSLNYIIDETLEENNIEEGSSIYWNSTDLKWEVKNKTLEQIINFPKSTKDKSVIIYDRASGKWTSDLVTNLITFSNDLKSLLDVNLDNIEDKDLLIYNSLTSKWESTSLDLNFLTDVDTKTVKNGYTLSWNSLSETWEARDIESLISGHIEEIELKSLKDVEISDNLIDSRVLIYNPENSKWESSFITPSNLLGLDSPDTVLKKYLTWDSKENKWVFNSYNLLDVLGLSTKDLKPNGIVIWNQKETQWDVIQAYELNKYVAQEIDLGELKNVLSPNKSHNQILTWDSALQVWMPKNVSDIGPVLQQLPDIQGNDWVSIFELELNY